MQLQCLRILGVALCTLLASCVAQREGQTHVEFEGIELTNMCSPYVYGSIRYVQLACAGQKELLADNSEEAVRLFEQAMEIPLHEAPNVDLYSKLALARHLAGDAKGAEESLQAARLAYSIELQVGYAPDIPTPPCPIFDGVTPWPGDDWIALNERLGPVVVDQVLTEVCSEGSSGVGPGLEGVWRFGPHLNEYFGVMSFIEGHVKTFFNGG